MNPTLEAAPLEDRAYALMPKFPQLVNGKRLMLVLMADFTLGKCGQSRLGGDFDRRGRLAAPEQGSNLFLEGIQISVINRCNVQRN
jgi:hypothetical protein